MYKIIKNKITIHSMNNVYRKFVDNLFIPETSCHKFPPVCFECKYHTQLSYHYPDSTCERFHLLLPCKKARINEEFCGMNGKFFEPLD